MGFLIEILRGGALYGNKCTSHIILSQQNIQKYIQYMYEYIYKYIYTFKIFIYFTVKYSSVYQTFRIEMKVGYLKFGRPHSS